MSVDHTTHRRQLILAHWRYHPPSNMQERPAQTRSRLGALGKEFWELGRWALDGLIPLTPGNPYLEGMVEAGGGLRRTL